jgi:hypothetical protein
MQVPDLSDFASYPHRGGHVGIAGAGIGYAPPAAQAKAATIAEVLARADKAAALAQALADRATTLIAQFIGSVPESARVGGPADEKAEASPVVVRQLNDRLTDAFTALNRIDVQLGRLQAALG